MPWHFAVLSQQKMNMEHEVQLRLRCILFPHFLLTLSNALFSELFENWFHCYAPLFPKAGNKGSFLCFAVLRKLFYFSIYYLVSEYFFWNNISMATCTVWVENCLIKNIIFLFWPSELMIKANLIANLQKSCFHAAFSQEPELNRFQCFKPWTT